MKTKVKVIVCFEYEEEGSIKDYMESRTASIKNRDELKGYLKSHYQENWVDDWNKEFEPNKDEKDMPIGKVVDIHLKEYDTVI